MIDPVTSYLGKKGLDYLVKWFAKDVVERCSRKRAINFFGAFVEAIRDGNQEIDIATRLDEILTSEVNTELLFEAHRLVCLSKSRQIGPRAIALLTAKIILEDRQSANQEDTWFQVYETFSDEELTETAKFYIRHFEGARNSGDTQSSFHGSDLVIEERSQVTLLKSDVDRSKWNFHLNHGSWAAKLELLGLIHTTTSESVWDFKEGELMALIGEDDFLQAREAEINLDEAGTARKVTHWIHLSQSDEIFAAIIERAYLMIPVKDIPVVNGLPLWIRPGDPRLMKAFKRAPWATEARE